MPTARAAVLHPGGQALRVRRRERHEVIGRVQRDGVAVQQVLDVVPLGGEPRRLTDLERALSSGHRRGTLAGQHQQAFGLRDRLGPRLVDRGTDRGRDARERLRRVGVGPELVRQPRELDQRRRVARGVGVRGLLLDGLDRVGERAAESRDRNHRDPGPRGHRPRRAGERGLGTRVVADHDHAVALCERRPVRERHRAHRARIASGLLQHERAELGRVLARPGPDEPDPARVAQAFGGRGGER